jgi:hypothetical protein
MERSLPVRHRSLISLAATVLVLSHAPRALALDPLGAYFGAAYGEGRLDGQFAAPDTCPGCASLVATPTSVGFAADHSSYQLMAGVRPIELSRRLKTGSRGR